jgi:RNA polymerase sigma factor (sigma-70 family)
MQYRRLPAVITGMAATSAPHPVPPAEAEGRVREAFRTIAPRLRNWLRRQLPQRADVEDVLQDVFYEFVLAQRALEPIGDAAAWLFRVARNRLIDRARRRKTHPGPTTDADDDDAPALEDLLPDPRGGPDAHYARQVLIDELEQALEALPAAQRDVFIAHELEGRSFAQLAESTGERVNTLLARKHRAVQALRARLREVYEDWIIDEGADHG